MTNPPNPLAFVIEDDADIAGFLAEALRGAGFDVEVSADGRRALQRLAEIRPDVIVLDLNLPHVSGETILRFIRADERLARIRVILTTAEAQHAEAIKDAADLVLLKPISYTQLRDLAQRIRSLVLRDDSPSTKAPHVD